MRSIELTPVNESHKIVQCVPRILKRSDTFSSEGISPKISQLRAHQPRTLLSAGSNFLLDFPVESPAPQISVVLHELQPTRCISAVLKKT